jgi:hypothetical protein
MVRSEHAVHGRCILLTTCKMNPPNPHDLAHTHLICEDCEPLSLDQP